MKPRVRGRLSAGAWVVGIATVAILLCSCTAPPGRLAFPDVAIRQDMRRTYYDTNGNGVADFATERNSDGRLSTVVYDRLENGQFDCEYPVGGQGNAPVPHLVLLLDSIPFRLVQQRYEAGHFRFCGPPHKVIAPFPSLTELCYTELLHAKALPGMIDQYYDQAEGRKHNNLLHRVLGQRQPWEKRLGYAATMYEQGLAYLNPRPWFAAELERARRAFERSNNSVTLLYITSASGMLSRYGEQGCMEVLDGAERLCLQVLHERKGAVQISIMADHGHNLVPSKNVRLDRILEQAGFHPAGRLRSDRDVVLEINGLVTYAAVHTRQPEKVADALLREQAVELAMYADARVPQRVIVRSARGAAILSERDGLLGYAPVDDDPLNYLGVLEALRQSGKLTNDGLASPEAWFTATVDHQYPDAPARIWHAFHGMVQHTPDVLVTLKDGYCAGLPAFERFITMASTHGGLNQINSATFVMTTTGRITRPLPMRDLLQRLEPRLVRELSIPTRGR